MKESDIKHNWYYFRSLASQLAETEQFVDHSINDQGIIINGNTFSNEFAKLLMLSSSEFEVISKSLCIESGIKVAKNVNIVTISKALLNLYPLIGETAISTPYKTIKPLKDWKIIQKQTKNGKNKEKLDGLSWWTPHNLIKHDRNNNFELANLQNCVDSLASLMVLELYLSYTVLGNIDKIKDIGCKYFDCEYGLENLMVNPGRLLPDFK